MKTKLFLIPPLCVALLFTSLFCILIAGVVLTAKREWTFVGRDVVSTGYVKLQNVEVSGSGVMGMMLTTAYSKADSCHYPTKNGKCLTASGTIARPGVAACPRDWPFGKKFSLVGKEYTCEDRYATYLSPRLDIWVESGALEWGAQEKVIYVAE